MAPDEPSGPRPAPVVLRIKLRYDDVESMVQRFAANVGKSGLFLPTKSLQPVGAEIKFELRITDDTPVLVGLGRVKAAKAPDPAAPKAAFGMAIELMRVTRESREVILRMLERRKQMGLPELGIPLPADIDAARRADVDTQVKDTTVSGAVPAPAVALDSGPSEALLTAPRRQSGPIAIAKLAVVEALAPEAPRKPRPKVHEVIESASGPIVSVVTVPGLDDEVDVGAALARARALAGGNLDAELEALREVAAAPLEITIEAASAELARQLGGAAVKRRDRSARWEKPPGIVSTVVPAATETKSQPDPEAKPEPEVVVATPVLVGPALPPEAVVVTPIVVAPEVAEPTPTPTAIEPPPAAPTIPAFMDDEDSAPVHVPPVEVRVDAGAPMIHDGVDPAAFEDREHSANEVEPDQIADEIHQLADGDYEEVEHTTIGAMPEEPAFANHAYATEPAVAEAIERSLDAQLAEAEAEADADDLGISGTYPLPAAEPAYSLPPAEVVRPEEVPAEDAEQLEQLEEIDDFEILAEADADDADLLAAHGEQDASGTRPRAPSAPLPEPPADPRASMSDFVSRLDLSDEFEAAPEPEVEPRPFSGRHASLSELDQRLDELEDPRDVSAGHALAAFDEPVTPFPDGPTGNPDDLDADSQYTLAGALPPADAIFDAPHAEMRDSYASFTPPPRAFDQSDVMDHRAPPRAAADDNYDLETALEALDVDLDELSVPQERPAPQPRAQRVQTRIPKRPTTEDGVLIDFDDDE